MRLLSRSRASTTLRRGPAGLSGIPEVPSGIPSPPLSPPLAAYALSNEIRSSVPVKNIQKTSREGIAYTITEECERLFCGTLKAVFLGERSAVSGSLVIGTQHIPRFNGNKITERVFLDDRRFASISPESSVYDDMGNPHLVEKYIEVYDYIGGAKFRGFIANNEHNGLAMFVFFDQGVVGCDLKPGLMALLELCEVPEFECSRLVVCVDRDLGETESKNLRRDLGWVGFEPLTLADWTASDDILSERWVFLNIDT